MNENPSKYRSAVRRRVGAHIEHKPIPRGAYIALEGPKGVGKTTILAEITARLRAAEIDFDTSSPTKAFTGHAFYENVWRNLEYRPAEDWFQELVFAERSNNAALTTRWSSGLIIGDRSIVTSYATRWRRSSNDPNETIHRVDMLEPLIPTPDHIMYLSAPLAVLEQRICRRGKIHGFHDENVDSIGEMIHAYEDMRHGNPAIARLRGVRWHDIDCTSVIDECVENVWDTLMVLYAETQTAKRNEQYYIL